MLEIENINSYYGQEKILFDVNMSIGENQIVSLIGRNGVGKTTTLRSVMNLAEVKEGSITYRGEEITGQDTDDISSMGIGYVPEDRGIFGGLTVRENLRLAALNSDDIEASIQEAYGVFPKLEELQDSRGAHLSGGEQQMLALGRVLINDNDLLLIDEPTEGLAPKIAEDVREAVVELSSRSTIVLVEQSTDMVFDISDKIYGMVDGKIVFEGTPEEGRERGITQEILEI